MEYKQNRVGKAKLLEIGNEAFRILEEEEKRQKEEKKRKEGEKKKRQEEEEKKKRQEEEKKKRQEEEEKKKRQEDEKKRQEEEKMKRQPAVAPPPKPKIKANYAWPVIPRARACNYQYQPQQTLVYQVKNPVSATEEMINSHEAMKLNDGLLVMDY